MKRLALMGLVLLVAFLITATVHARPWINFGTFCTEGYATDHPEVVCDETFTTKFFKEKFFGGGPGELGNVLMAKGQGFMLQNVKLQEAVECDTLGCGLDIEHPCYGQDWQFMTTYEGGMLTLNSKGPWLDKGMLKAKGLITATNYSRHDAEGNLSGFCMVITGEFRNAPYGFNAWALFEVTEDNYQFKQDDEGNPVFQRGYDFDALIEILDDTENTENIPQ